MGNLEVKEKREAGRINLTLIGDITDSAALANLELDGVSHVNIDFSQLGFVNSAGLGAWIFWTRNIDSQKPQKVVVENIPARFARIMFAVKDIMPPTWKIKSFAVSYFCESCNATTDRLLSNIAALAADPVKAEQEMEFFKCSSCAGQIEMDDAVSRYLEAFKKYG